VGEMWEMKTGPRNIGGFASEDDYMQAQEAWREATATTPGGAGTVGGAGGRTGTAGAAGAGSGTAGGARAAAGAGTTRGGRVGTGARA